MGEALTVSSAFFRPQQRPARPAPDPDTLPVRPGRFLDQAQPPAPLEASPHLTRPAAGGVAAEPRLTQPEFSPLCSARPYAAKTFFLPLRGAGLAPARSLSLACRQPRRH